MRTSTDYPRTWLVALLTGALLLSACQPGIPAPDSVPTATAGVGEPSPIPAGTPAVPAPDTPLPNAALPLDATAIPGGSTVPTAPAGPAAFFNDQRLLYEPDFYTPEIQAFLETQPTPLKSRRFSVGNRQHSLAEVLIGQTSYYSLNPKVVLALMEAQSGVLSSTGPSADQINLAMGYAGESGRWRGLQSQIRWSIRQMVYARRDYPSRLPLVFSDESERQPPANWSLSEYVIGRVLAQTTSPGNLDARMQRFLKTYTRLFGDPRSAPDHWPAPAEPFLVRPTKNVVAVSSFFDHDAPFLMRDPQAPVATYWGRQETDASFAYDGHDGWDYAAASPDRALAAAAGLVVFAGNADDGCATGAIVIDHRNGYRTLYWHMDRIDVEIGQAVTQGEPIGVIGNTGCSQGPHLHFGTQYLGRNTDPYGWCGSDADPWAIHPAGTASRWLWMDRPSPCGPAPAGAVVVDTESSGFFRSEGDWQARATGYGGGAEFIPSLRGTDERQPWKLRPPHEPAVAIWRATLPSAGRYRVLAYIPYALSGLEDPRSTEYRVRYATGEAQVLVNARIYANDWADLGTYDFTNQGAVILSNLADDNQLSVWVDAVLWIPE